MRKIFPLILAGLLLITFSTFISGCKSEVKTTAGVNGKKIAAVSIIPEKTFVEAVCGNLVEVVTMIPPGSSPHNYEPTPREIQKFSQATVYFAIGVPTEETNILPSAAEIKDLKIVRLDEEVEKVYAARYEGSEGRDPHIWLSPKRVKIMVECIAREMVDIDPANQVTYEKNAAIYLQELDKLDLKIKAALENKPNKKIIVFHPSFGYLADDYGIHMYALEEEGKEATFQRMFELVNLARQENIKAIFYQAEVSGRQAQSFAEEIGGKTVLLDPLAPNYIENLEKMAALMAEVMN